MCSDIVIQNKKFLTSLDLILSYVFQYKRILSDEVPLI